jgi:hypothetical protein
VSETELNKPNRLLLKASKNRDLDSHVARLEMTHFGDQIDEWVLTSIKVILKRNRKLEQALSRAVKISQYIGKVL